MKRVSEEYSGSLDVMRLLMYEPRLCTLHELYTVYDLDDFYDFIEMIDARETIDAERVAIEKKKVNNGKK